MIKEGVELTVVTIDQYVDSCFRCGKKHEKWKDFWHGDKHYQVIECECSYVTFMPTGLLTSGIFG